MSFDPKGYVLHDGEGTPMWFLGTRMTLKATSAETNGAFTLLEWSAPVSFGPPLHRHEVEDESFYLLDGTIEVTCGDQQWTAGPGDFVFLPHGIPHLFTVSAGPVRGLQITAPGGFEGLVSEVGSPAQGPGLPPPAAPDIPRLIEACSRHGQEILGPPPR